MNKLLIPLLASLLMLCQMSSFAAGPGGFLSNGSIGGSGFFGASNASPRDISNLEFYLDSQSGLTQGAGATDFDGTNDKLVSGSTTELSGDISFEICAWIKVDSVGEKAVMAKSNAGAANAKSWMLKAVSGGLGNQLQFTISADGIDDGGYTSTSAVIWSPVGVGTAWHFVRIWHDATTNQIGMQIDDGTKGTTSFSNGVFSTNQAIRLGARLNNGSDFGFFDGQIDSVAIVNNGRLSDADATHLYNLGLGRNYSEIQPSTRANLTHFYNLNGGSGTFKDSVGSLDLTPSGSPASDSTSPVAGCISAWQSQTAGGYSFTPTAAEYRPDYVRSFGNGSTVPTPAIGFWRTALAGDTASKAIMNAKSGGTFFIVYRPVYESSGENNIFYYQAGGGQRRFQYAIVNTTTPGDRRMMAVALDGDSGGYIQKLYNSGFTNDTPTFECVRMDYAQAKGSMWSNGQKMIDESSMSGVTAGNTSNTNSTGVWIGANGTSGPGKFTAAAILFYNRKLTDAEVDKLEEWAYWKYFNNPVNDYVVLVGDSNMQQSSYQGTNTAVDDYLSTYMAGLPWPVPYTIQNLGHGGDRVDQFGPWIESNYDFSNRYYLNPRNKFMIIQGFTNDNIQGADQATQITRMRTLVDTYTAKGWKIFVATPVPMEASWPPDAIDSLTASVKADVLTNGVSLYGWLGVINVYDAVNIWGSYSAAENGDYLRWIHLYPNADPNNGPKQQANQYYSTLRTNLGI